MAQQQGSDRDARALHFIMWVGLFMLGLFFLALLAQVSYGVFNLIRLKDPYLGLLPTPSDKFEVFRDVLLINLALLAAIGYGVWLLLKHLTLREFRAEWQKELSELKGNFLVRFEHFSTNMNLSFSYLYWLYETDHKGQTIDQAISHATWATGEDMPKTDEEMRERYFTDLTAAKNNLAFFLAYRHHPLDSSKALELANELKAEARKINFKYPAWMDTYFYVRAHFVSVAEVSDLIKELEAALEDPRLASVKDKLRETLKYLTSPTRGS